MRVLLVGHDAGRSGAPILLRHVANQLRQRGDAVAWLMVSGGPLEHDYASFGECLVLGERPGKLPERRWVSRDLPRRTKRFLANRAKVRRLLTKFRPDVIYVNTLAAWPAARYVTSSPAPWLLHVHELQSVIEGFCGTTETAELLSRASAVVACSRPVRDNLIRNQGISADRISLVHEFIDVAHCQAVDRSECRRELRSAIGAGSNSIVVGGLGYGGLRKGTDLFLQLARHVCRSSPKEVHFVWVGALSGDAIGRQVLLDLKTMGLASRVHFVGEQQDPRNFLAGIDLFALTSREDPYPLAALEAAAAGVPIFCFADAGGMPDFVGQGCGQIIPYLDIGLFAEQIVAAADDPTLRQSWGESARRLVTEQHDAARECNKIRSLLTKLISGSQIINSGVPS